MGENARGGVEFLRPAAEPHTDRKRVIGYRTRYLGGEHRYLRGYEVVIVAVCKNALRVEECRVLADEEAVRREGGVGPDDRVEVAPVLPDGTVSFVTSDPKAVDLEAFSFLRHPQ